VRETACQAYEFTIPAVVRAKEMLILVGRRAGASMTMLSELMGLASSTMSRRHEAAARKVRESGELCVS
jgi:hypothetical protein